MEEVKTTAEQLMETLESLRIRLKKSGVERTQGLKGSMGKNCEFFKKSLNRFIKDDYQDIKTLIFQLDKLFKDIEGPNG